MIKNVIEILKASGSSIEKVVKTTLFITCMDNFSVINEVYGDFFSKNLPARACIEVDALPRGVRVELEAIAMV